MNRENAILRGIESIGDYTQAKKDFSERIIFGQKEEKHTINEHIRSMILAMLTAGRIYEGIKNNLDELDKVFMQYDPEYLKNENPEKLIENVKKIKCGNRRIKPQMYALKDNIVFFQKIEKQYGNIDSFYHTMEKHNLVCFLSCNLKELGQPLVSEYLPGVGWDVPKPDVHLKRILGKNRLGFSNNENATIQETYDIISNISDITGEYEKYIDYLFWSFCAEGEKNICGKQPKCDICPISQYCNKNRK